MCKTQIFLRETQVPVYKDKKAELDAFFDSIISEPATYSMYELICSKKKDFLDWLRDRNLIFLISNYNITSPVTEFEWFCRQEILSYIAKFDLYILQVYPDKERIFDSNKFLSEQIKVFNEGLKYEGIF